MKRDFQRKGFTIIETSLVIAIGGLILLMVFVALPALQRSQRDTSRRESVSKLITELKNYQINNRGSLPVMNTASANGEYVVWEGTGASVSGNSWRDFYGLYLGDNFVDPDGERYELHIVNCATTVQAGGPGTDAGRVNGATNGRVLDAECAVTASGGAANVSEQDFPNNYNISVVLGAVCSGTRAVAAANPRMVAVLYKLEGAGEYCANT